MARCFVIQPFDGGAFDKRYVEVLVPAIVAAGFEPYRVDWDPSVKVPIESIMDEIENAEVCLADVSENNPNIWFELGYAMAKGRSVLMICKSNQRDRLPFDIQHRTVVQYGTDSTSDFSSLSREITARLSAFAKSDKAVRDAVSASPLQPLSGLSHYEIAILVFLLENRFSPDDGEVGYAIQQALQRSGFTKAAATLGLEKLLASGYIESTTKADYNGEPYAVFGLSQNGMKWLLANESILVLTSEPQVKNVALEYDPFADE